MIEPFTRKELRVVVLPSFRQTGVYVFYSYVQMKDRVPIKLRGRETGPPSCFMFPRL